MGFGSRNKISTQIKLGGLNNTPSDLLAKSINFPSKKLCIFQVDAHVSEILAGIKSLTLEHLKVVQLLFTNCITIILCKQIPNFDSIFRSKGSYSTS